MKYRIVHNKYKKKYAIQSKVDLDGLSLWKRFFKKSFASENWLMDFVMEDGFETKQFDTYEEAELRIAKLKKDEAEKKYNVWKEVWERQ